MGQKSRPVEEASMAQVMTIGLDIAKHIFQVHGAGAAGHVLFSTIRPENRACCG